MVYESSFSNNLQKKMDNHGSEQLPSWDLTPRRVFFQLLGGMSIQIAG